MLSLWTLSASTTDANLSTSGQLIFPFPGGVDLFPSGRGLGPASPQTDRSGSGAALRPLGSD